MDAIPDSLIGLVFIEMGSLHLLKHILNYIKMIIWC